MDLVSDRQRHAFYGSGYVIFPGLFNSDEVDAIAKGFDRIHDIAQELMASDTLESGQTHAVYKGARFSLSLDAQGRPAHVRFIAWVSALDSVLERYGEDRRLLQIAAELMGCSEMDHLINQAHYKRPGSKVSFAWHQDSRHRGISSGGFKDVDGRGSYVQTVLAVDDVQPDSGPLSVLEKSCKLGHIDEGGIPSETVERFNVQTPLLKRGDAVAFGPYTVHGSEANTSAHSRRVFINGFAYPGADLKVRPDPNGEGRRVRL